MSQILITGATSGIGLAAAEKLVAEGHNVVIIGRNQEKCEQATQIIFQKTNQNINYLVADLSIQAEVKRLAAEYKQKFGKLDVLINNAGILAPQRVETIDGLEITFATNHMAYFILTNELLPLLKQSVQGRVVNVASEAHRMASMRWDDLQFKNSVYEGGWSAYAMSKLCNILFTVELAKRLEGTNVTVNCLHPGVVASGLWRDRGGIFGKIIRLGTAIARVAMVSPAKGSETTVYLATEPSLARTTGKYFNNKQISKPSLQAMDSESAAKLWQISEQLLVTDTNKP